MMITYKSRFLTRAEVWYDDDPEDTRGVDWILYERRSQPVAGARTGHYYTYAIDLTQSAEQLLANLSKDTAYKIRRARERDRITCEICDPREPSVLGNFEKMYNAFAALKGRTPLNWGRIQSMAAAARLDLSVAKDAQGKALVYHANYHDSERATSLESPSLYRTLSDSGARNLIGRANRYLTWANILRYKGRQLKCFDFGGWYPGKTDQERLDINCFKAGFGGTVVREYQCERILTLKCWLVLRVASLLERMKSFSSRPGKTVADIPPEQVTGQIPVPVD